MVLNKKIKHQLKVQGIEVKEEEKVDHMKLKVQGIEIREDFFASVQAETFHAINITISKLSVLSQIVLIHII